VSRLRITKSTTRHIGGSQNITTASPHGSHDGDVAIHPKVRCCLDWQLGETRFPSLAILSGNTGEVNPRSPPNGTIAPKVQSGLDHAKFQSLAFQAGVPEPNSQDEGMRYWRLCRVFWEASIGPHVSGPPKFLNRPDGRPSGACFQLFEMEFTPTSWKCITISRRLGLRRIPDWM